LVRRGWKFLFHDVGILGVQLDLLMRDPSGILMIVEVKTQGRGRLAHLNWSQRRRLMRIAAFLAQWEPVELRLALVEGHDLRLLPVD